MCNVRRFVVEVFRFYDMYCWIWSIMNGEFECNNNSLLSYSVFGFMHVFAFECNFHLNARCGGLNVQANMRLVCSVWSLLDG